MRDAARDFTASLKRIVPATSDASLVAEADRLEALMDVFADGLIPDDLAQTPELMPLAEALPPAIKGFDAAACDGLARLPDWNDLEPGLTLMDIAPEAPTT